MEISEKITYLRKQKGWSQEQLAIKVEVSRQAVYKWEAGISQPEIDKLKKLSTLFSVSFDELLDDSIDITVAKEKQLECNNETEEPNITPMGEADNAPFNNNEEAKSIEKPNNLEKTVAEPNKPNGNKSLWILLISVISVLVICICALAIVLIQYLLPDNEREDGPSITSSAQASLGTDDTVDKEDEEQNGSDENDPNESNPSDNEEIGTYYTVRLETEGGTSIADIRVKEGELITNDLSTVYEGHVLLGWVNIDTYKQWDFDSDRVYKDTTLYAFWATEVYYTVKFETLGGTPISDKRVKSGELITGSISTHYKGYKLLGWTLSDGYTEWDFENDRVYEDITLCAIWVPDLYVTVVYDKNDGSGERITVYHDKSSSLILNDVFFDSTKTLLGWTTTPSGDIFHPIDSEIYIDGSCTFYAVWFEDETEEFVFVENGDGGFTLIEYAGKKEYVEIPAYYNGRPVTRIGSYAFSENMYALNVYLPDTVMKIQPSAFTDSYVENIYLSRSVYEIDSTAFNGCYGLKNIFINGYNNYFASIGGVLYNEARTRLVKYPTAREDSIYYVPDGTHYINDYAFYGCYSLVEVTIPDGCGGIGVSTFEGCIGLERIDVGNRIDYVGGRAFCDCNSLQSIEFEYDLYSIGKEAFLNCVSLTTVVIKGNVGVISYHTFGSCISLTTVIVGGVIKDELSEYAFEGCSNFQGITYV